jgi:hypothetical protein
MGSVSVLFAYIGPDVTLPLMSMLAAVFGFIMMVGRAPIRYAAKVLRRAKNWMRSLGKGNRPPTDSTPEEP